MTTGIARVRRWSGIGGALVVVAVFGVAAAAQTASATTSALSGRYEGTSSGTNGMAQVQAELKHENGTITGSMEAGGTVVQVTAGTLNGEDLTLTVDMQGAVGSFNGKFKDGRIEGSWALGDQNGTLVLTRRAAAVAEAGNGFAGEWEATADTPNGALTFGLRFKVDGETVTGETFSPEGSSPVSGASIKDGVLTFTVDYGGAPVVLRGRIEGGVLVGTYDYNNGEFASAWQARRRVP
jgi:hypothetical protein